MAGFIISRKLNVLEALEVMERMEIWFRDNPRRKICQTEIWKVRRGHLVEDILKHTLR